MTSSTAGARFDVIGLGESSIDYVYEVPQLPTADTSKVRITSHFTSAGGQVATTMAACAALGLRAAYLGPLGDDSHAAFMRGQLDGRGVDLSRVITRRARSRFAVILVDADTGDRRVLWDRDPALSLTESDLPASVLDGARLLHVDAVDESAAIHAAGLASVAGIPVTCDIDSVTPRTPDLLHLVTTPILAEHVPAHLTGREDLEAALRELRRTHRGTIVVTLGERGSAALDGDQFYRAEAFPVQAVDTTGAGDVFRAGVIVGLLSSWPIDRTLSFANAAAALSCTRRGALGAVPSREEVQALVASA